MYFLGRKRPATAAGVGGVADADPPGVLGTPSKVLKDKGQGKRSVPANVPTTATPTATTTALTTATPTATITAQTTATPSARPTTTPTTGSGVPSGSGSSAAPGTVAGDVVPIGTDPLSSSALRIRFNTQVGKIFL